MRRLVMMIAAVGVVAGCREGVEPFTPEPHERMDMPARQLTFGFGQDRDPQWMPDSEMLLYHTDGSSALPTARGALLNIDRTGGVALPVLQDVQRTGGRLLVTPVVSPDGKQVAYLDLVRVDPLVPCAVLSIETRHCAYSQPRLDSAALRVRRLDASTTPQSDPAIGIRYAGADPGLLSGTGSPYIMQSFPFQVMYGEHQTAAIRPSWSPDNQRVAFSNGMSIHVWRVGDAAATPVPNTQDAIAVDWSPDGQRIVFAHVARLDSVQASCGCARDGAGETHRRMLYTTSSTIVTQRLDGTDRVVVGAGEEPAWSHDGQFIFARDGDRIIRMPAAGGAAVAIPAAAYGRSPAPSPDGRWLAFAYRKSQDIVDWDIWVVALSQ